jgi:hypothetical protein
MTDRLDNSRRLSGLAGLAVSQAATKTDRCARELFGRIQVEQDSLDELVDALADDTLKPIAFAIEGVAQGVPQAVYARAVNRRLAAGGPSALSGKLGHPGHFLPGAAIPDASCCLRRRV